MIKFFVGIFSFLMVILGIIFVSCAIMLALACFDFLCDSDIKGQLVRDLGDRHLLKDIRKNVLSLFDKFDTPSKEDYAAASYEQYKQYICKGHVSEGQVQIDQIELNNEFKQKMNDIVRKAMVNAKEETDS